VERGVRKTGDGHRERDRGRGEEVHTIIMMKKKPTTVVDSITVTQVGRFTVTGGGVLSSPGLLV
jgi:hypothetical protein